MTLWIVLSVLGFLYLEIGFLIFLRLVYLLDQEKDLLMVRWRRALAVAVLDAAGWGVLVVWSGVRDLWEDLTK